jgi:pimeloyl-ACP methyl ester carboxylesterase
MTTVMPAATASSRFVDAERVVLERFAVAAEERYIDLAEPRVRVRVLESGAGPPVLLLHGMGSVAAFWAPLLGRLQGLHAIAVERPGCGLSDSVDFRQLSLRPWSVQLIAALVTALGHQRVSIIGNSIGGTMALWFAIERPDLVDRLVLIGAPPFVLDSQAPLGMRIISIPFITHRIVAANKPADIDRSFERMGHPSGALGPELVELGMRSRDLPGYEHGFGGLLRSATGLMGRKVAATDRELAQLHAPTMLIWGARDTHAPVATGRRMVSTIADARLEVCGTGHLPWLDEPERCAALASEFLSAAGSR